MRVTFPKKGVTMKTTRFGMSLDADLLEKFDDLTNKKGYANRSEAIRDLIRDLLTQEEWETSSKETIESPLTGMASR